MNHQESLRKRLSKIPISAAPAPWKATSVIAIGGLTEGGYLPSTDTFLAITSSGRGLFDALSGEKIARDRDESGGWIDEVRLTAEAISPHAGVSVRIAGLAGGGLPLSTEDGWRLEVVAPDWPRVAVFLEPLGCSVLIEDRAREARKVFEDYEPRVIGFSETGRTFVIATSDSIYFFKR